MRKLAHASLQTSAWSAEDPGLRKTLASHLPALGRLLSGKDAKAAGLGFSGLFSMVLSGRASQRPKS